MSAVPVSHYLADFALDGGSGAKHARGAAPDGGRAAAQEAAARLEEAYARGLEAGSAEARAEFAMELATQRDLFDRQLASDRQSWATDEGERIAQSLASGLRELEARIAETTARILKPFLAAELQQRAIAELAANLETLTAKDSGVSVHVSGPADLLEALRARLADKIIAVAYAPGGDCDLRVRVGETILETRLGDWMARLGEAVR